MMTDTVDLMQLASAGQKLARRRRHRLPGRPCRAGLGGGWHADRVLRLSRLGGHADRAAGGERTGDRRAGGRPGALRHRSDRPGAPRRGLRRRAFKELEAQLAERAEQPPPETPMQNQTKMLEKQAASLSVEDTTPAAVIQCPDCGKGGWKNTHALDVHRGRAHAPQQFVEELGWHCAAKGCSGAHARDLHDPAFCTLHATPRTNGVLS
jgi:hypothetical protein